MSMKPGDVAEEQTKLRASPFSSKDSAKDWLYYLPSGSITTWKEMKRLFLEECFPSSSTANIRKEICGVRQDNKESLHKYCEHFKRLCASCHHHQISEQLHIQYFYEGLLPTDRSMIDTASGEALMDKTSVRVKNLIASMAATSQQFDTRLDTSSKHVNEITKACGMCSVVGHSMDMCPPFLEDPIEEVNAASGFLRQLQRNYDPYSNTITQDGEIILILATGINKCEFNIPLLHAIKQVPHNAKFLKELYTIKRKQKFKGCEKVRVGENISAVIQRKLSAKCKDPGMFTILCVIGDTKFEKAMLDLRASINVMPYSIYTSLKLKPLNKIGIMIRLD
ncbi:uncharacterized protein LOC111371077 [Olea europaea var. sylvestris]|uniref:uncharacterized protein LOC111371077 n=1 Tax=Olea europaea var. sylvestris TaxID=158386 RepID=UPI000C1CF3BC|nr:uncharacterized protein LOC111371077 [Olea europaea var. sylvestris]